LLHVPGVKADTMVMRFVRSALSRNVSQAEAERLVTEVAKRLGVDATTLDHAIWSRESTRARSRN